MIIISNKYTATWEPLRQEEDMHGDGGRSGYADTTYTCLGIKYNSGPSALQREKDMEVTGGRLDYAGITYT